jgi:hypothetical protein
VNHSSVDEHLAAGNPVQPTLVDDLDVEAALLEEGEHLQRVAGLGEHVHVLGGPDNARVAGQGIGSGQKEWDLGFRHQPDHFLVETLRRAGRLEILGRGERLVNHSAAQRNAGEGGSKQADPRSSPIPARA